MKPTKDLLTVFAGGCAAMAIALAARSDAVGSAENKSGNGAIGAMTSGSGSGWIQKTPMNIGRAEVGVEQIGSKIYVIGGTEMADGKPPLWDSTLNTRYDPATDTWQAMAPLPFGLTHVGTAVLDGKLYVVGGFTAIIHVNAQSRAYVYDPVKNMWTRLPDFSSPRGSVSAVAVNGKIHIFGGRGLDKVPVNTHEIYDPDTKKWSIGKPIPGPGRDHLGIALLDGKIHIVGGRTGELFTSIDLHDVYDPATDRWSSAAPLPDARSSSATAVLSGRLIYAGGECKLPRGAPGGGPPHGPPGAAGGPPAGAGGPPPNAAQNFAIAPPGLFAFDNVTAYDPKTDTWTALPALPFARHAFGAATVKGSVYFIGGAVGCGGGGIEDVLDYSPNVSASGGQAANTSPTTAKSLIAGAPPMPGPGSGSAPGGVPAAVMMATKSTSPEGDEMLGQTVFKGTCGNCHGAQIPGIPQMGDAAEWKRRLASAGSKEVLYEHAIKGFSPPGGIPMLPKGGNPTLTDAEVKAGVDYILAHSQ